MPKHSKTIEKTPLLLTTGARPASVYCRGGEVMIYVHDAWYLGMKAAWRADILDLHPDSASLAGRRKHGKKTIKGSYAMRAISSYKFWLRQQIRWYRQYRMHPPAGHGTNKRVGRMLFGGPQGLARYVPPSYAINSQLRETAAFAEEEAARRDFEFQQSLVLPPLNKSDGFQYRDRCTWGF